MRHFPRLRRRNAAIVAAGLAGAILGLASVTHTYSGQNAGLTVGNSGCFVGIEWRGEPGVFGSCTGTDPDAKPHPAPAHTVTVTTPEDDVVKSYNAGWKAGVRDLGHGTHPTYPDVVGDANDPGTVAWADGWIDGQADALGDDDRDGKVEPGEQGWHAHRDASHTSR